MNGAAIRSIDQAQFAAALLDPTLACPAGLRTWNDSDPVRRIAVYRNNVVSSLIAASADTFAVTRLLVGPDFFRAMAGMFVRQNPPRTRILAHYGDDFAAFIASFAPAAALPYLPDMARLELRTDAGLPCRRCRPDRRGVLSAALSNPDKLAGMQFKWHPSLRVIDSPYAVVTLWAAHQTDDEISSVQVDHAERAIVLRDALDVLVLPVAAGTACFVGRTLSGVEFSAAAAAAVADDASFDLSATLSLLVRHGALVSLRVPRSSTSSNSRTFS